MSVAAKVRGKDDASVLSITLKDALRDVGHGAKVKEGGKLPNYVKNAKGSLLNELGALDLDTLYSIIMSSVVSFVLVRANYFLKPAGTSIIREFLTFTLYELLQPKLSGVLPRVGVYDIDTHRYRAGRRDTVASSVTRESIRLGVDDPSRRIAFAGQRTEVGNVFNWELMFKEWANALPVIIVAMVVVDVGLGKRSDLRSVLHYMFIMLVVSASRFVKNRVLVNNPGRQTSMEIFRRTMALGHSYESVPKVKFEGKIPPRLYTFTEKYQKGAEKPQ